MALSADKKRLSIESGSGITPWEVAQCIGDFRTTELGRDVGLLCSSPKVNKWAKNKPVEAVRYPFKEQDDTERKLAAWGFHWWNTSRNDEDAPFATTASALYAKAKSKNFDWIWNNPRTVLRLNDFDGYNHSARQPYEYSNDLLTENRVVERAIYIDPNDSRNELLASMFPSVVNLSEEIGNFKIAVIYTKDDGETVNTAISDYTVADVDRGTRVTVDLTLSEPINPDFPYEYKTMVVATNATEDIWMYLPKSMTKVTVKMGGVFVTYEESSADYGFMATNASGNAVTSDTEVSQIELDFMFENKSDVTHGVNGYITIWNTDDGYANAQTFYPFGTSSFQVGANSRSYQLDNVLNLLDVSGKASKLKIAFTYEYSGKSRHFDFINGVSLANAASESDGVTVLAIIQKRIADGKYV